MSPSAGHPRELQNAGFEECELINRSIGAENRRAGSNYDGYSSHSVSRSSPLLLFAFGPFLGDFGTETGPGPESESEPQSGPSLFAVYGYFYHSSSACRVIYERLLAAVFVRILIFGNCFEIGK